MKKILVAACAAIFLAGCQHTLPKIETQQLVVIEIPASLYNCRLPPKPPKPETLTNKQVAEYIDEIYKRLIECNVNMNKIKVFVDLSKKSLEAKQNRR